MPAGRGLGLPQDFHGAGLQVHEVGSGIDAAAADQRVVIDQEVAAGVENDLTAAAARGRAERGNGAVDRDVVAGEHLDVARVPKDIRCDRGAGLHEDVALRPPAQRDVVDDGDASHDDRDVAPGPGGAGAARPPA